MDILLVEEFIAPVQYDLLATDVIHKSRELSTLGIKTCLSQQLHTSCGYVNRHAIKRIGSDSLNAQVFMVNCTHNIAMKIMPLYMQSSSDENEKEIKIAKLVSDMVIRRESKYFPILYAIGKCDNVVLNNRKFLNTHILYRHLKIIKENKELKIITDNIENPMIPPNEYGIKFELVLANNIDRGPDNLKSIMDSTGLPFEKQIEFLRQFMKPEEIRSVENITLSADIMFSELANCDMKVYINTNDISIDTLIYFVRHTILALIDLQKLNCIHNDLHLGNLLILNIQEIKQILIHDFGMSQIYDDIKSLPNKIIFADIRNVLGRLNVACKSKKNYPELSSFITYMSTKSKQYADNTSTTYPLTVLLDDILSYNVLQHDDVKISSGGGHILNKIYYKKLCNISTINYY